MSEENNNSSTLYNHHIINQTDITERYLRKTNLSRKSNCFASDLQDCPADYYKDVDTNLTWLWQNTSIALYITFGASMVNSVTILLVLSQKKYRSKLVPCTLILLYLSNMVLVNLMIFSKVTIPFEDSRNFNEERYCEGTHMVAGFLRSVTNWTLAFVSLVHASTIYFPANFIHFRRDSRNSFWIFIIVVIIAMVSTLAFAEFNSVVACKIKTRMICVSYLPLKFVLVTYIVPMGIAVFSSVSICYSIVDPGLMTLTANESHSSHRVNKLIIGSTVMFTVTSLPLMLYVYWLKVDPVKEECNEYFYKNVFDHAMSVVLTSLTFSLDSVLFLIISPPYRNEVYEVYENILRYLRCLKRQASLSSRNWSVRSDIRHNSYTTPERTPRTSRSHVPRELSAREDVSNSGKPLTFFVNKEVSVADTAPHTVTSETTV